jgi:ferredoxin-NADP reductase
LKACGAEFYFNQHINRDLLLKIAPDLHERVVYLCGPTPFMGVAVDQLLKAKVPHGNIILENFEY